MPRKTGAVSGLMMLFLLSFTLHAQVIRVGHCKVDLDVWPLPACAIETKDNELFIVKDLIAPLGEGRWTQAGDGEVAWTALPSGFAYFDQSGKIVVAHVAPFDNGPSPFHEGLVRVEQNKKWGLADANGNFALPLEYDGILEFEDGQWLACKGCTTKTTGEYHFFSGGSWVVIDKFGKVKGPANDPAHN